MADFPATCTTVDESISKPAKQWTAAETYIGARFGQLEVIEIVRFGDHKSRARCRCDCGQEKTILLPNVVAGLTRSCGCLARRPRKTSACPDGRPHAAHNWHKPGARLRCEGVPA